MNDIRLNHDFQWSTTSRCPKCDVKIYWNEEIKKQIEKIKSSELPKEIFFNCKNKNGHRIRAIIFIDVEIELDVI